MDQIEPKEQPIARSVEETARVCGVGRTTVFEAIRTGQLRAKKIGRRTVILDQDSRAWLNAMPAAGQSAA